MKHRDAILKGFGDAVPVACGMIACSTAMLTAYEIGFKITPLILYCVFVALLLSFWMNLPKYGPAFGVLFLASVVMLIAVRMPRVGDGATVLIYRLFDELPKGLSWLVDMDKMAENAARVTDPETCISLFLMIVAAVIGFVLSFALIRSKMILLPMLLPLPMLLVSLVYTNKPPKLWTMVLLTVYFGYTLLGNGLRRGELKKRGLFAVLLAPMLLALVLSIVSIFPEKAYEPLSAARRKEIFSQQFGTIVDTAMSWFGVNNPHSINLSREDERKDDETERFTVVAKSGVYHLRTHSYGAYRDNRWRAAGAYRGAWNSMEALGKRQEETKSLLWVYDYMSGERVTPYAWTTDPAGDNPDERASAPHAEESFVRSGAWKDYGWHYAWRYSTDPGTVTEDEREYYESYALKQYVMEDGEEKEALLDILKRAGITASDDSLKTARMVAAYVQDLGEYSLTPGEVPKGKDFVLYFLTENPKGYCVHFASATTALLQALGVPARYTVGYYVEIPQEVGKHGVTVTANDEHAWTEVYVLGLGWVPVESTKGRSDDSRSDTPQQTQRPNTPDQTPVPSLTPEPTPEITPEPTPEITPEPTPDAAQESPEPTPEPSELPGQTPAPEDGNGTVDPEQNDKPNEKRRGSAWWILIPLVPLAWLGAGLLMRRLREQRFRDPDTRRSIPDMAEYLRRMERFGIEQEPKAEEWALEAGFSNHSMKEEHRLLLRHVHAAQRKLYADQPLKRFIFRWVLYLI